MNADLEEKGLELLVPLWSSSYPKFGSQENKIWDNFGEWMKEKGLIDNSLDITKAFDKDFVDSLD